MGLDRLFNVYCVSLSGELGHGKHIVLYIILIPSPSSPPNQSMVFMFNFLNKISPQPSTGWWLLQVGLPMKN